jgi:hypothetical protein
MFCKYDNMIILFLKIKKIKTNFQELLRNFIMVFLVIKRVFLLLWFFPEGAFFYPSSMKRYQINLSWQPKAMHSLFLE